LIIVDRAFINTYIWEGEMEDLTRNVQLLCPVCGNNQFETFDTATDEFMDATDETRFRCSDCGNIFTKRELIDENQAVINENIEEVKQEAIKEIQNDLKKALKKWR